MPDQTSTQLDKNNTCPPGRRHALSLLRKRIEQHFVCQGYSLMDGPEVEAQWYHFDALNMDKSHYARASDHTFYIENNARTGKNIDLVLRAHTSPMQVRAMLQQAPPFYKIGIGRVYRPDPLDSTHSPVFNQLEGLVIDKYLSINDLKVTLNDFAKAMFGNNVITRYRPYEFAYARAALELDVQCVICHAQDTNCLTCHGEGWIELGGCGMVHSNVLANCGVDENIYNAFSFGIGVERTQMLQMGIHDLRTIVSNDTESYSQTHGLRGSTQKAQTTLTKITDTKDITSLFVAEGFIETLSFPFINSSIWDRLGIEANDELRNTLQLCNTIAGLDSSLRTSLIPSLLICMQRSQLQDITTTSIFEQACVFKTAKSSPYAPELTAGKRPSNEQLQQLNTLIPPQPQHLAALSITDKSTPYFVKFIHKIANFYEKKIHIQSTQKMPWATNNCLELSCNNQVIGYLGQLHSDVICEFQLPIQTKKVLHTNNVMLLEIDLSQLSSKHEPKGENSL